MFSFDLVFEFIMLRERNRSITSDFRDWSRRTNEAENHADEEWWEVCSSSLTIERTGLGFELRGKKLAIASGRHLEDDEGFD